MTPELTKDNPEKAKELESEYTGPIEKITTTLAKVGKVYTGELDINENAFGKLSETFSDLGKNGGVVSGFLMGGISTAFALAGGVSEEEAAKIFYESAVPYGETQLNLIDGDMEAARRSTTIETTSNAGSFVGVFAGASAGQVIIPIPIVGAAIGGTAVGKATEYAYDNAEDITDFFDKGDDRLLERLPLEIDNTAPPELQNLVEIKKMLVEAQIQLASLGGNITTDKNTRKSHRDMSDKIELVENMYDDAYDTYEQEGDPLEKITAHLDQWEEAGQIANLTIDNMKADVVTSNNQHETHAKLETLIV